MAFPPVSIIVPTGRNTGPLAGLVAAVKDLDYPLFELMLSCEKGTDLPEGVTGLISTSNRIRIITTEHANPSSLRNAGIKASRYELLAFTDSDCTPDRAWLKELVVVKQTLGTGAVVGRSISSNYSRSRWSRISANRYSAWMEGIREGEYLNRLDTRNLLIAKGLIERLGAFDEDLPSKEDRDLGHRLAKAGEKIGFAPLARVGHRDPETMGDVYRRSVWYARGMRQFLAKHGVRWLRRSRELVFYKRYVGESLWAVVALLWYGALLGLALSGLAARLGLPVAILVLAGIPVAFMAFRSVTGSVKKFLTGRSTSDDLVFDVVSDLGHKVGYISAALGIWRGGGGRQEGNHSSRNGKRGSR